MRGLREVLVFVAVAGAPLAGCSAILGFQNTELLTDASTSGDARTGTDGKGPQDANVSTDGSPHDDGKSPRDATVDALDRAAPDAHVDSAACDPASVTGKLVFITDKPMTGDFGDDAGPDLLLIGDSICQGLAGAAGLGSRTFLAWLSEDSVPASARFHTDASAGPYRLPDNTIVAHTWTRLTSTNLLSPIDIALDCKVPSAVAPQCEASVDLPVWTGTYPGGMAATGQTCADWTTLEDNAAVGNASAKGTTAWTVSCVISCSDEAYLYCIEQ
jgi:hypothetical protein